jgi:hypothetical protein
MTREELVKTRAYKVATASTEYWNKNANDEDVGIITAFEDGVDWAEENPSTELLLKIFWFFDKHGLIRDDLCFDPEHFMDTVAQEHLKGFDVEEYIKNGK